MASSLTKGGILDISRGKTVTKPILQVVDIKKLLHAAQPGSTQDRYRFILSDGQHYQQAMLGTQLNRLVVENLVKINNIVQLNEYMCNNLQQRRILIILNLAVIDDTVTEKIGNPVNVENLKEEPAGGADPQQQPAQSNQKAPQRGGNNNQNSGHSNFQQPPQSTQYKQNNNNNAAGSADQEPIFPISSLNPYQNRWTIKARVARKSIRDYTNQKGGGKILSVDLVDANGEIRATAFNDVAIQLDRIFEENNIYYVSKGQIKFANKKFNTLSNEYEVTFDSSTTVMPCNDDASIPKLNYNFKPIASITEMEKDALVDVIGVIRELEDPAPFTFKDGRSTSKRSVMIADESDASIKVTLWGAKADDTELAPGVILSIKGAKISDYGGKSLTLPGQAGMEKNPDRPETFRLQMWYNNTGANVNHVLSQSFQPSGGGAPCPRKNFQQAREEVTQPNQTSRFMAYATVTSIKEKDEFWYAACPGKDPTDPSRDCNKKILPLGQQWTCEKCNGSFDRPRYRYIISLRAADYTGSLWFTAFNDVAEKLLQVDADTVIGWKQQGLDDTVTKTFKQSSFQPFNMRILAKGDVYNDDTKVKYTIQSISPINYVERSRELIQMIKSFANN